MSLAYARSFPHPPQLAWFSPTAYAIARWLWCLTRSCGGERRFKPGTRDWGRDNGHVRNCVFRWPPGGSTPPGPAAHETTRARQRATNRESESAGQWRAGGVVMSVTKLDDMAAQLRLIELHLVLLSELVAHMLRHTEADMRRAELLARMRRLAHERMAMAG